MGVYRATCPDCGKIYMWCSHTLETIARGARCEECWKKLFEKKIKQEGI